MNYLTEKPKKYLFDGCKLIYHQERLQDFLDGKRVMPLHIDMGIHKNCNIRCVYCYGMKQHMENNHIPTDRLMTIADDAKGAGIKSIAIIGDGEPTLNEGLYPFVERLHELGVDCSVATNGLLLDNVKTNILTDNCTWIRFNLSAVGDDYDKIHKGAGEGAFDKLEKNIKYAVANKKDCTIGLQMVLIPQCFDQIVPLAEKAVEWGVDYLVIKQFSDPGEGIGITFEIEKAYAEAKIRLKEAESMATDDTAIIVKWNAMQDSANITDNKDWGFDRCIDLPLIFQISGNGGCYPCGYHFNNPKYCYGNVNETDLWDILNSDKYWDIIEMVANTPLEQLCKGQCRHCETLKFMDKLTKGYAVHKSLPVAMVTMCGSIKQYKEILKNPPDHINFI